MKLKGQPGKNISIGSLNVASQAAQWDLIDEYHFVVHPVIAGAGPRLFESGANLTLKLIGSKTFRSGVIALRYHENGDKTLRIIHWVIDPETGAPWASMEAVALTFDVKTRKALTPSPEARERVAKGLCRV